MKNDESIKLLAYYLKKLYINDSIDNIYNKIKLNINNINSKNISKLFMLNKNEEEVINNVIVSINKESKININDGNKLKKEINKKDNYVFEKMTYPMYLFIEKLYISLIRDKSLKVYFFAREGQFLKKLFDTYQQYIIGPKIESAYLYVSRASTFLGTLKDIKEEKFEGLFHQYPNMSLEVFCKNIAFNKEEINKIKKINK